MTSCRGFDVVMLKNERIPCASEVLDSVWISNSSPSFKGVSASMVNFEQAGVGDCKVERCDEELEELQPAEKKRRLTAKQVQFLEKSFEVENKLEPDRKIQLAKELGLQPRQVAIWFQNRRARYKSKLLEKEYDSLKSCFDKLKKDYENLYSDNQKLKNEVDLLKQKVVVNDQIIAENDDFEEKDASKVVVQWKTEDASSSARSDVLDSDRNSSHSNVLEAADHQSDFSQEGDDSLLVQRLCFPKLEVEYCYDDLHPNSCNLGFPLQNQDTYKWYVKYDGLDRSRCSLFDDSGVKKNGPIQLKFTNEKMWDPDKLEEKVQMEEAQWPWRIEQSDLKFIFQSRNGGAKFR